MYHTSTEACEGKHEDAADEAEEPYDAVLRRDSA
jgi:hypothetical protein